MALDDAYNCLHAEEEGIVAWITFLIEEARKGGVVGIEGGRITFHVLEGMLRMVDAAYMR